MTIDRSKFEMRSRTMPDDMASLEKLTPATLRGAQMAVVEIDRAVIVDARRGENRRTGQPNVEPAVVLRYKEIPSRLHWLNKAGVNILCDVFGDDEQQWVGMRIPIVVKEGVKNPTSGERNDMVWVANSDEWVRLFDEWDKALAQRTPDAPKVSVESVNAAREAARKRSTVAKSAKKDGT